jgi:catechol 2,3-dioxygenase-like lactoylglutathione lyase family enzyme
LESESSREEIIQVGLLVKDVEEAAKKFEKLIGIGPFEILEPAYREMTFRGKRGKFKIKIALAKAGSIQVELIQPLYGKAIYEESIQRRGYGLHHLAIRVDNMERSIKEMETKGFKVIQSGNRPGIKWAYFNTEEQTNVIFEFIERETPPP